MRYGLAITAEVTESIRILPPLIKRQIRGGLESIQEDPHLGKPLQDDLHGLWSYRVSRYRIVYLIHEHHIEVEVIDLGPRSIIYERVSVSRQKQ